MNLTWTLTPTVPAQRDVHVLTGPEAVREAVHASGAPSPTAATASPAWVRAASAGAPPASLWAVQLRSAGRVEALAVLRDDVHDDGTSTRLLTGGDGYEAGVLAASPRAARALGAALAAQADRRGTALRLEDLPDDPLVRALAAGAGARVRALDPVPVVVRPGEGEALVSAGMRKNLRKTANRLRTDGVDVELRISTDPAAFAAAVPELEVAYRDRDTVHGIACALDTPQGRRTWRSRLEALGELGRRELAELRLDGELAAYVVGVPGGPRYGIFEGRFVTRWARYSPGRLLEHAVLEHAFASPGVQVVDWMTGVAPETLLAVSRFESRLCLDRPAPDRVPPVGARRVPQPASAR